ncbi:MAG: hypothetical protein ACJ8AG_18065 [Ktedonobacteraceae bacterium]
MGNRGPSFIKGDWCFRQGAGERKRQHDALKHDFFSMLSAFASVDDGDEGPTALDRNTTMVGLLQLTFILTWRMAKWKLSWGKINAWLRLFLRIADKTWSTNASDINAMR